MITYTPGQRISVRGEDFLITEVNDGGEDNLLLDVVGISPLVADKAFCFDTKLEQDIQPVRPENTHFVADTQSGYRLTKLYRGVLLIHKFECKPFRKSRSFGISRPS